MKFNKHSFFFHVLLFAAIFDASSIQVLGVNIRASWLVLPFLYLFIVPKRPTRNEILFVLTFTFVHLLSVIYNRNPNGIVTCFWIVFNFIFFYRLSGSANFQKRFNVKRAVLINGRIQIILGAMLVVAGLHARMSFVYYEPSYMAIGLIPYTAFSLLGKKVSPIDALLILLFLALGQSANYLLVIFVIGIIKFSTLKPSAANVASLVVVISLLTAFITKEYWDTNSPNHQIVAAIIDGDVELSFILDRAGNRMPRASAAYEVFLSNQYFGVGPGNYTKYIESLSFSHITNNLPWLDVHQQPPINIFIEVGVNAGLLAILVLLVAFLRFVYLSIKFHADKEYFAIVILLVVVGLFESSYLRGYCWIFFGLIASHIRAKQISSSKNKRTNQPMLEKLQTSQFRHTPVAGSL